MIARTTLCLGVVTTLFLPAPADAQIPNPTTMKRRFALWAELGAFAGDATPAKDVLAFSPQFGLSGRLSRPLELEARWGMAFADSDPDGGGTMFGNPYVGFYYVRQPGPRYGRETRQFAMRAGGGLAFPVADVSEPADGPAFTSAAAMRGLFDYWLWRPDTLSLVGRFRLDGRIHAFVWGVDLGAGLLAAVDDDDDDEDTDFDFQAAVELAGAAGNLIFGGRIQAVMITDHLTQFALAPFFRLDRGRGVLELSLLMNLDHPYGFAFDDRGIYGLLFMGGGRF